MVPKLTDGRLGAVLVFMPGWAEIKALMEAIQVPLRRSFYDNGPPAGSGASRAGVPNDRPSLLALLRGAEHCVFCVALWGEKDRHRHQHCRDVCGSGQPPVAITQQVTIDDVVIVINSGKVKETR